MLILAAVLIALVMVFAVMKKTASGEVYSRFGLSKSTHQVLSTDLGEKTSRIKLSRLGVNGIPDAIFKSLTEKVIVVGEFKSRKYRGEVRLYEFYQILLYMGHVALKYPDHKIIGCLAYADNRASVAFDKEVYEALMGLRDEYWQTLKSKRPVNPRPLHKRIKVTGANSSLRFSAKL